MFFLYLGNSGSSSHSNGSGSNNSNGSSSSRANSTSISSEEDAKNYIDGKTFTSAPAGATFWYKASFSNGNFTLWRAMPSQGTWGSPVGSGSYVVYKMRNNAGELFFPVMMDTGDIMTDMQFNLPNLTFKLVYGNGGDFMQATVGDKNPWN